MFDVKGFIPDGWSTCVSHSIMCYNSTLERWVLLIQQLCYDTCVGNVTALAGKNLNHKFHWNCGRISIEPCGVGQHWPSQLSCVVWQCAARVHWGVEGRDAGHQVKTEKAKFCHCLNELFKLLCACPSHSLWLSPGTVLGCLALYGLVLCRSLQDPPESQGRWW